MLTFPADKSDFAAPNGVTYAWDDADEKWRVKAFRSIDDFIVQLEDNPPADSESKEGDLWFDTSPDALTLYIYTGSVWVPAAPPVSLDGINATIEAALIVQNDLLERVTSGETTQGVQNNQINALETQVQLLAGVRAVGRWTYRRRVESNSPRPPATAAFYGTHKDDINTVLLNWSDLNLLMINKTDKDGNIFTFSDFEEGDKVEIIASDGSSACYGTVTNNPSNDVYANMIVAVERSNSGPVEEKEYLISAYRPGSSNGEVDLDILDGRYVQNSGTNTVTSPWKLKADDKTYISVSSDELHLYHIADPTGNGADWAANKGYVDTAVENIIIPGHDTRRPPGLRFMYESGSGDVSDGTFKWYTDGGGQKLKISATSQDFKWGTNSPIGDISYSESHLFHIYATTTNSSTGVREWKVKTSGSFNRMDWHANHILLYVPYNIMNDSFSTTAAYFITISGLF